MAKQKRTPSDRKPPPVSSPVNTPDTENIEPKYHIQINLDGAKLTWGDLFFLNSFRGQEDRPMSFDETVKMGMLFDHLVVGGVENVPMEATPDILRAMHKALDERADIKN